MLRFITKLFGQKNKIFLFNTLSRQKEVFKPINKKEVGFYACGPTVYNYPHLGNLRTYIFEDILKRVFEYNGYKIKHVMNITDVGHLTGDRDMGEDKLQKEAKKEGRNSREIAEFYTKAFKEDLKNLNIISPSIYCKATDHIKEQIELIKILEKKGFTYKTSDGIYFDTSKVEDYTKLSHQNLEALKEGARIEVNPEKKNPTDFALWKFSPKESKRDMEWQSPWGVGFPGWHIECSAMSVKYLGEHFDIHAGAVDFINLHHTNEIAQTESATGKKPWVNFWIHGEFLSIDGGRKMAKSAGDIITLNSTFIEKGINPLVYRFATFMTHYRKQMEWSDTITISAKNGLDSLYSKISHLGNKVGKINKKWKDRFVLAVNDDLNIPQAMAVLNEMLRSDISSADKLATALDFDRVFGLEFKPVVSEINSPIEVSEEIKKLLIERENARKNKDFKKSDEIREKIKNLGYQIEDTQKGQKITK